MEQQNTFSNNRRCDRICLRGLAAQNSFCAWKKNMFCDKFIFFLCLEWVRQNVHSVHHGSTFRKISACVNFENSTYFTKSVSVMSQCFVNCEAVDNCVAVAKTTQESCHLFTHLSLQELCWEKHPITVHQKVRFLVHADDTATSCSWIWHLLCWTCSCFSCHFLMIVRR